MTIIQLLTFPVNEEYAKKADQGNEALKKMSSIDGFVVAYTGLQNEDEIQGARLGYVASVWESFDHHQKFMSNTELHSQVTAGLKPALAGDLTRDRFEIVTEHTAPLEKAQTTEFVAFVLNEGASKDTLKERIAKLSVELDKAANAFPQCVWGESLDNPGKFVMAIGWTSRQAHLDAVSVEPFTSVIGAIKEVASVNFTHTDLNKA